MTGTRLETIDVRKTFGRPGRPPTRALGGVSLEVAAGEFLAVAGPSGCGKTTLLQIMVGLLRPTSGVVRVDGRPVTGPARERAIVFQEPALLPWRTARDNVAYGIECGGLAPRLARVRAAEWLAQVGLAGFGEHYPHELSGGMQQRVNLARALATEPDLLLMDEPFASLDAQTREALQAELLGICEQERRTVVFVTHDIGEAIFLADRVAVLTPRPGRVREVVPIDLPRPRDLAVRHTPAFQRAEATIRSLLARAPDDGSEPAARETAPVPARRGWSRWLPFARVTPPA